MNGITQRDVALDAALDNIEEAVKELQEARDYFKDARAGTNVGEKTERYLQGVTCIGEALELLTRIDSSFNKGGTK